MVGVFVIPCYCCVEVMEHEVYMQDRLYVKFGAEYSEVSDNVVVIPESDGELNIAWFLYEFIALTIPLKHVHQAGKCNKSMSAKLRKHAARSMDDSDESEDAASYDDEDVVDEVPGEGEETDPRWDELKKILDNN